MILFVTQSGLYSKAPINDDAFRKALEKVFHSTIIN